MFPLVGEALAAATKDALEPGDEFSSSTRVVACLTHTQHTNHMESQRAIKAMHCDRYVVLSSPITTRYMTRSQDHSPSSGTWKLFIAWPRISRPSDFPVFDDHDILTQTQLHSLLIAPSSNPSDDPVTLFNFHCLRTHRRISCLTSRHFPPLARERGKSIPLSCISCPDLPSASVGTPGCRLHYCTPPLLFGVHFGSPLLHAEESGVL